MRKSWLLYVCLGTLAWGQTPAPTMPAPATPAQAPGAATKPAAPPEEVAENAVVLTIKGVCPAAPKTAAASKAGAGKTAAAKKPADCKTEITRAQFEKIASGLSPNVTPQLKRQLENALPRFMAMSEAAKAKGLDKTPRYQQTLQIAKMQILTQELQRSLQEQADKVSPDEVSGYYKEHADGFEQFSLDRLFIPRYKTVEAEEKDDMEDAKDKDKDKGDKDKDAKEPEKLTDEQQKAKEAEEQAKREKGEQELNKLADSLREKAAAGEDFTKLQKEAFGASGTKVENPTVNLPKVRRTGLPPAHAAVFELKVNEVSAVISDNGGHYVYKVIGKEVLPLDQVKDEIHNKLKTEKLKAMTDKYTNSFQAIPNEAYFGPATPPGRPGMMGQGTPPPHMRPQMPMPQGAAPTGNPPPQAPSPAPAQQAPSAKPD